MHNLRVFTEVIQSSVPLFLFSPAREANEARERHPERNGDERDREMTLIGLVRNGWMEGERKSGREILATERPRALALSIGGGGIN